MKYADLDQDLRTKIKKLVRADDVWMRYIDMLLENPAAGVRHIRTVVENALKDYPNE